MSLLLGLTCSLTSSIPQGGTLFGGRAWRVNSSFFPHSQVWPSMLPISFLFEELSYYLRPRKVSWSGWVREGYSVVGWCGLAGY